jgi:predicted permease
MSQASRDPRVLTNSGAFTGATAPALFTLLFGAAICVALIACLNLAGLELASGLARGHVRAVQTALGASRGVLLRTALWEGLLLGATGSACGYLAAVWGSAIVHATLPAALDVMLLNPIDIDHRAAAFTGGCALFVWFVGSSPLVWFTSRSGVANALRRSTRAISLSRGHLVWRHIILAAQMAATVLLLSGAALFLRSYTSAVVADRNLDGNRLATIDVAVPVDASQSREERERVRNVLHERLLSILRRNPNVLSAGGASGIPPGISRAQPPSHLWIERHAAPAGLVHLAPVNGDDGYLQTLGLRVLAGRALRTGDSADSVVVDVEFARRFWPAGDALGARFITGTETAPGENAREIVGIVSHLRPGRAWSGQPVYVIHTPGPPRRLSYLVRVQDPAAIDKVAAALRELAPTARITAGFMADQYADMDGDTRIATGLTSGFAVLAFIVAIAGIYGVTALVVAARTREIGIRLALGATPSDIRRSILVPTMRVVSVGLAAGVGAALLGTHWIESLPLGVTGAGLITYVTLALGLAGAAILAGARPTRQAGHVNPAITLRAE